MRGSLTRFALAMLATTAFAAGAAAQTGPCVNDLPNPYKQVTGWEKMPREWAPTNNVYVDGKDNVWVMARCGAKGCVGPEGAPIWELSSASLLMVRFLSLLAPLI